MYVLASQPSRLCASTEAFVYALVPVQLLLHVSIDESVCVPVCLCLSADVPVCMIQVRTRIAIYLSLSLSLSLSLPLYLPIYLSIYLSIYIYIYIYINYSHAYHDIHLHLYWHPQCACVFEWPAVSSPNLTNKHAKQHGSHCKEPEKGPLRCDSRISLYEKLTLSSAPQSCDRALKPELTVASKP